MNNNPKLPIVGVGASAGGLVALESFFSNMPSDTGIAFVVIQHLSKHFKSLMDELLARYTDMKIHVAENGMVVSKNTIYLIPPGSYLALEDRRLKLTEYELKKPVPHYPIDHFFKSLAEECGSYCAGVILSGAGSDGSVGLKAIHAAGGLVLVQSEDSARFGGMPQSAIDTGLVDIVLEPDAMSRVLQDYFAGNRVMPLIDGTEKYEIVTGEDAFSYILSLLQNKYKVDFNHYKIPTLARRIERRMGLAGLDDEVDYARLLYDDNEELDRLFRDMLVDVTYFFRDKEAFDLLAKTVIPELVSQKQDGDIIRIWTAGCATGEETYSLAMLFDYEIKRQKKVIDLKVFATDLHQDSIRTAATGIFDDKELESIPEALRAEYIVSENNRIYIDRELRRKIIFAQHDLIKDSTFTGLDFISCRNVLIYFLPEAQHRVLAQFHFGLTRGGVLFLGPSEHLGGLKDDFQTLHRTWRIFSKSSDRRYLDSTFLPMPRSSRVRNLPVTTPGLSGASDWESSLLTKFMPDSILVDHQWYLVRTFGNGSTYLRIPAGRVDLLITRLIADDLVTPLRGALYRSSQEEITVRLTSIEAHTAGGQRLIDMTIEPILNGGDAGPATRGLAEGKYYLIIFESRVHARQEISTSEPDDDSKIVIQVDDLEYVEELERELTFTRESLQATIEELETTNEELQSANEELLAANEELQSTNEELHSVNEELYTVNSEYLVRNEELTNLHEEMRELQKLTGAVIIVLDRKLAIKSFSPAAGELLNILPHDVGRLITDLRLFDNVTISEFELLLESGFSGGAHERITSVSRSNKKYLMQIIPHAPNLESDYDSLVLSLINVSSLEKSLNLPAPFDLAVQSPVMLFIYDVEKRANLFCTESSIDVMGYTPTEIQAFGSEFMGKLVHPDDQLRIRNETGRLNDDPDGTVLDKRFRIRHKNGSWIWVLSREMVYKRSEDGTMTQFVGAAIDVTEEIIAKNRVQELEAEISRLKHKSTQPD